jgi:hypothetical protein
MIGIGKLACRSLFACGILVVSAPAGAQAVYFSGPWAVNGQLVAGPVFAAVMPVCQFTQVANKLSGTCQGPNAGGPATGAANGPMISFQWQIVPMTPLATPGIASFQGTLGPDNLIRGTWTSSNAPGASGPFTAHRP